MKKFFLIAALAALPMSAFAADLPRSAVIPKAPPAPLVTPGWLYGFIDTGMGWTAEKNSLVIDGFDVFGVNPHQYPTGWLVGGGLGADFGNTAIGSLGLEARVHYNFNRGSFGCGFETGCAGYTKNSWLFQGLVGWSPFGSTPFAFTGWGWTQNLNAMIMGGVAGRTADACLFSFDGVPSVQAASNGTVCDTKFLVGYDAGFKITAPLSADRTWNFRVTFDYIGYNQEVVHKNSPVFTNETGVSGSLHTQHEMIGLIGIEKHFTLF